MQTNITSKDVVAVVLTHNRKKLLIQVLDGLCAQTLPLSQILIVDNASTDGTKDELLHHGFLSTANITYIRSNDNLGPSGGFKNGINNALKLGHEWIWILDDDVVPFPNCLENLLAFKDIAGCIAPARGKNVPFFNPAVGLTSHNKNLSFENGKNYVFSNTCCFEGMLVSSNVIRKAGLPDERFFQVNGDTIYGFTISLFTNIVHVKNAKMQRLLNAKKPITANRVFLLIRNQFLISLHLKKLGVFQPSAFYSTFIYLVIFYLTILPVRTRSITLSVATIKGLMHGWTSKFGPPNP